MLYQIVEIQDFVTLSGVERCHKMQKQASTSLSLTLLWLMYLFFNSLLEKSSRPTTLN
jgi:hypothetical protein